MADNKKVQEEDLKKLEDEAYFELCQIIAEAMELQDVDLLNARIASWKNKYKKLLDRPSTNSRSDFKKRIEFLLTQYYSEVTKYILSQLKLQEEKKIENQSKALRELYTIIRDTNDLDLLKKKVKKWEEKYPVSAFLKMYQKRIELYTREKNLKENAFEQEQAFNDLVDVTKVHGTLDELKNELALWEEKYSINNKYTIDDFLKHQTEVKRFTSDEFLQSIAREDPTPDNVDKNDIDIVEEYNNNACSDLSVQANSYAALLKISKSPDSVNEMFTWVYKNRGIKFNDKYKELVLSATYLLYSPTYLKKMKKPKMDMSKSSLSFDEYKNINDIKKYAIISYFNLLLPPEKAVSNDYFNKHIETIYAKSERARVSDVKDEVSPATDIAKPEIEISLKEPTYAPEIDLEPLTLPTDEIDQNTAEPKQPEPVSAPNPETHIDLEDSDNKETVFVSSKVTNNNETEIVIDLSNSEPILTIDLPDNVSNNIVPNNDTIEEIDTTSNNPVKETSVDIADTNEETDTHEVLEPEVSIVREEPSETKPITEHSIDYPTIVAFSPLFFEAIHNYHKQSVLVGHIDSTVTKYVETEKSKESMLNQQIKTKIDEE